MNGRSVFSNTLIELLILLLVIVLTLLYFTSLKSSDPTREKNLESALKKCEEELQQCKSDLYQQVKINKDLEDKIAGLRSKQTPSCIEKGIAQSAIATIQIAGSNAYIFKGQELSFNELTVIFQKDLIDAKKAECVHIINVSVADAVNTANYVNALKKLESVFYIKKMAN